MKRWFLGLGFIVLCGVIVVLIKPSGRPILQYLRHVDEVWGVVEDRDGVPWVVIGGNQESAFPYKNDSFGYRYAWTDGRIAQSDLPVIVKYSKDDIVQVWRASDGKVLWP